MLVNNVNVSKTYCVHSPDHITYSLNYTPGFILYIFHICDFQDYMQSK